MLALLFAIVSALPAQQRFQRLYFGVKISSWRQCNNPALSGSFHLYDRSPACFQSSGLGSSPERQPTTHCSSESYQLYGNLDIAYSSSIAFPLSKLPHRNLTFCWTALTRTNVFLRYFSLTCLHNVSSGVLSTFYLLARHSQNLNDLTVISCRHYTFLKYQPIPLMASQYSISHLPWQNLFYSSHK